MLESGMDFGEIEYHEQSKKNNIEIQREMANIFK